MEVQYGTKEFGPELPERYAWDCVAMPRHPLPTILQPMTISLCVLRILDGHRVWACGSTHMGNVHDAPHEWHIGQCLSLCTYCTHGWSKTDPKVGVKVGPEE